METHLSVLRCRSCGADLSEPVTIREAGMDGVAQPEFRDHEHVIDAGYAFKSEEPYRKRLGPGKDQLEFTPQYWMTARDLLASVQLTKNQSHLNGCCGLDGSDGPNRVCACGADIGTEMSDCWTSYLFIPDPEATEWRTLDGAVASSEKAPPHEDNSP